MGLLEKLRGAKATVVQPVRRELPPAPLPYVPPISPEELTRQLLVALTRGDAIKAATLCKAYGDLIRTLDAGRAPAPLALAGNAAAADWYRQGVALAKRFCTDSVGDQTSASSAPASIP